VTPPLSPAVQCADGHVGCRGSFRCPVPNLSLVQNLGNHDEVFESERRLSPRVQRRRPSDDGARAASLALSRLALPAGSVLEFECQTNACEAVTLAPVVLAVADDLVAEAG